MNKALLWPIVLLLCSCTPPSPPQHSAPPAVAVAPVTQAPAQTEYQVNGRIRSVSRAQLTFQTDGVLLERLVKLGDRVAQGDLLAVVRNPRLQPQQAAALAAVAETRARLEQARRDLKRLQTLRIDRAVGEERVEQQAAEVTRLEAALQQADAQLETQSGIAAEARLLAPFAGEISRLWVEPGEYVSPGQPVLSLADPEQLEIWIQVPARYASLEPGQSVTVTAPLLSSPVTGVVDQFSHQADPETGLYPAVVRIASDAGVDAGQRATVLIPEILDPTQLTVPIAAVVDPIGGAPRVYRVASDQIEQVAVELGRHLGQSIIISGALQPGDQVVISGHQSLTDGQSVQVLP
ncbi:MAG: efflux RND transporter periplasmic adaptor subunit [Wenzhouxiangellaceae bacterium]